MHVGGAVPSRASHTHLSMDRLVASIDHTVARLSTLHVPQDLAWSFMHVAPCIKKNSKGGAVTSKVVKRQIPPL